MEEWFVSELVFDELGFICVLFVFLVILVY